VVLASGVEGDRDALPIGADARVLGATLRAGQSAAYTLAEGRRGYLVADLGAVRVNGVELGPRDGAAIENERTLDVTAVEDAEVLLVDVP
jgi:redox-sensitive bicupin YhaK (pirin superfamily)